MQCRLKNKKNQRVFRKTLDRCFFFPNLPSGLKTCYRKIVRKRNECFSSVRVSEKNRTLELTPLTLFRDFIRIGFCSGSSRTVKATYRSRESPESSVSRVPANFNLGTIATKTPPRGDSSILIGSTRLWSSLDVSIRNSCTVCARVRIALTQIPHIFSRKRPLRRGRIRQKRYLVQPRGKINFSPSIAVQLFFFSFLST